MICSIVLISRKWVGLDIFSNKWGDKFYLNVAKTENYTSRSGVRKRTLCLQSQKEIKNLFLRARLKVLLICILDCKCTGCLPSRVCTEIYNGKWFCFLYTIIRSHNIVFTLYFDLPRQTASSTLISKPTKSLLKTHPNFLRE